MNFIVAVDLDWGIGMEGNLLTRIPEDMKFFREKTTGNVIVMGRKTLATFPNGKPLKDRVNIILSRDEDFHCEGAVVCKSIEDMLKETNKYEPDRVFVVGGGSIYSQLIPYCDTAFITKINSRFNADTYISNLDENEMWTSIYEGDEQAYNGVEFKFTTYKNLDFRDNKI